MFENKKQHEIADEYGISRGRVTQIINKLREDEELKVKLTNLWKKRYSVLAKSKALGLVDEIYPKKHPRSKLAIDSGILVDKARLLDGESTENISVHVVTERIESRKKRLEELYKEVGI